MYIREHLNTPYDEYVSYLQNKYGLPAQNPPVRKISEIKYVGKEMCQCISVEDPSHTYLTDNLTITGDSALKVLD